MNLYDLNLPDTLKSKLDAVEKQLRRMETVVAVCGSLFALLLIYILLFTLDRFIDTPAIIRHGLALVGAGLVGLFLYLWMRNWVFRRRTPRDMARLVQKRHRILGDRLLGVVELAEGDGTQGGASPELVQAAINQVAREAEGMEFTESVSGRKSFGWGTGFAVLALSSLGLLVAFPDAAKNTFARLFNPSTERYTFTKVQDLPKQLVVGKGEPIRLKFGVEEDSARVPDKAVATMNNAARFETELENKTGVLELPQQLEPNNLKLKVGDDRTGASIVPVERPALQTLEAHVALPAYLERPQTVQNVRGGRVSILEGSTFVLKGQLSPVTLTEGEEPTERTIKNASIAVRPEYGVAESWLPLKVRGDRFETEEFRPETFEGKRIEFDWTDEYNLSAAVTYPVQVNMDEDEAPQFTILGIDEVNAILEEEVLTLEISATDDFGLQYLEVEYFSVHDPEETGVEATFGGEILEQGSPTATMLPEGGSSFTYQWSPIVEHVKEGSAIHLVVKTADYRPDRGAVTSLVYKIDVLTRAAHAEILRERMERIQAELEEVARDEEQLIQENKDLAENPEKATEGKLSQQKFAEMKQAERMKQMAEAAKDIVKQAMKNPDINPDTMQEWSEMSENMKNLSEQELKEASKSMSKASQSESDQEKKENIEDAVEKQEEALKKMREMERKANESITDMVAQNFVRRLKQRAKEEKEIGQRLKALALSKGLAGAEVDDLDDEIREILEIQAAKQLMTRKHADYIERDLKGFYNRTKEDIYKEIYDEMGELEMNEKLDELADLIVQNSLYKALGMLSGNSLKFWEDKFNEWAGKVEEATKNQDQPPQEGDPQEMEKELMDILYALLRAQGREEAIRSNTRLLEEAIEPLDEE